MRVVPTSFNGTDPLTGRVESNGIVVDYRDPANVATELKAAAAPLYDKEVNGVRLFQTYLDIDKALLANLVISGNNFEIADLDESGVDTDSEKFAQVEIEYLFNGV